jgi:hypothetical protein
MKLRRWPAALAAVFLLLAPAPAIFAAAATPLTSQNMTVSPTQIKPELDPGVTATGQISVINDGDKAYDFTASATPYHVSGEDYDQSFQVIPGAINAATWFTVPKQTYHLEPHATQIVPYSLAVPKNAQAGGYYAVLFFQTVPKPTESSGVQRQQRVGVVSYIKVKGATTEKGSVSSFEVDTFQPGKPVTALLRLRNDGNVHYTADINLRATDVFGAEKAKVQVTREVLPGTIRRFDLHWDKSPALGLFKLGGNVNMLGRNEALPSHYVLVISPVAFFILLGAFCLVAISGLWWWRGRRLRNR